MPAITENELKKQIREGSLSRAYLLYGDEKFLIETYAARLREKAVPKGRDGFNVQSFDGTGDVAEALTDFAEQFPMMADCKCAMVCDYEAEKKSADELKKMAALLSDIPPYCVLIFWMDSVEVNEKKSAKWRNFIKQIQAAGQTAAINRRTGGELNKILCETARKRGCLLSERDASYLVNLCGSALNTLLSELEKLINYTGEGEITREAMDKLCIKTLSSSAFDMAKAILRREYDRAYAILDELFYQREEPVSILSAISMSYVDLYRAKVCKTSPDVKLADIVQKFGYYGKDFRIKNAMRDCASMDLSVLRGSLDILLAADQTLKSQKTQGRVVLEQTIARLVVLNGK